MKNVFLLFLAALCLGLMGMGPRFPGDGYDNPDDFFVSGHGPALSYTDNGNGTFTDNVTKLMWEKKTDGGIHDVDDTYTWSTGTFPDGTLWDFLDTLNNTCEGEGDPCESNKDCPKGSKCGFAGYRDWCIPNVKKLQSIVDYSMNDPASSVPGSIAQPDESFYWSSTTRAGTPSIVWFVYFLDGTVSTSGKDSAFFARAVRPCS